MKPKNKNADDQDTSLEDKIATLEALVTSMEDDNLSLADSMEAFEQGIKLTREAQQALTAAEQKVQLLMEVDGEPVSEPFDEEGE